MRITNTMITNNTLLSINRNQEALLKLNEQYTSGKKIQRPSDDPISAVRALKLRTDLSEIKQYQRNTSDATSWLETTEQAFNNTIEMVKRIKTLSVQASSGTNTYSEREKILKELEELYGQISSEGNVNYGGRYVFTGYKTSMPLTFTEKTDKVFEIEEKFNKDSFDFRNHMKDADTTAKEPPKEIKIARIRLGYSNISELKSTDINIHSTTSLTSVEKTLADTDAFEPPTGKVYFIKETGELIFNKEDAKKLSDEHDFSVTVNYEKNDFVKGDKRPEHYFKCYPENKELNIPINASGESFVTDTPVKDGSVEILGSSVSPISYTYQNSTDPIPSPLGANQVVVLKDTGKLMFGSSFTSPGNISLSYKSEINATAGQNIEYEISVNQKISVNTLGKDVYTVDFMRNIEEIIGDTKRTFDKINELERDKEAVDHDAALSDDEKKAKKEDLSKRLSVFKDFTKERFNEALSKVEDGLKVIVKEHSALGSRLNRVKLTENRLGDNEISFTDLLSKAEDANLAEVYMNVKVQEAVYKASLTASSKAIQPTLLDFIR